MGSEYLSERIVRMLHISPPCLQLPQINHPENLTPRPYSLDYKGTRLQFRHFYKVKLRKKRKKTRVREEARNTIKKGEAQVHRVHEDKEKQQQQNQSVIILKVTLTR